MSSPPSSPEPHRQQNQLASAESSTTYRVYYFTHMPEKGRTIWVVLFCRRVHSLAGFALRLYTSGPAGARQLAHTLRANTDLSWTTVHTTNEGNDADDEEDADDAEGVHQYKVAFDCPNDTFAGRVFGAELVATSGGGGGEVWTIDLGVMKVVSTTSVRKRHYSQLEQLSPSRAHQRLVANFKRHHARDKGTASRRHHANGKGVRQRSRRGLPFLLDEYRQAVELSIARTTT
jgi:hypothetical protein